MFKFFTKLFKKRLKKYDNIHKAVDDADVLLELNAEIEVEDLISKGVVELKMFDTKPEHAKEYGLDSKKPLYVQTICVSENERLKGIGNKVLQYIDDYAIKNGHDVVFGHITQKAQFSKDNRETFFCDIDLIKHWLHSKGYAINSDNNDFHKLIENNPDISIRTQLGNSKRSGTKPPDHPIADVLEKLVLKPTEYSILSEEKKAIKITAMTGAVNKKRRKKQGGWKYIRIHSNHNALSLHLSELAERNAEIILDGMKLTWWYK